MRTIQPGEPTTASATVMPAPEAGAASRPSPSALQIANEIIIRAERDRQPIDLPKLQALLYLCQSGHLAVTGQQMFPEPILAGPNGPYVESVAVHFAESGIPQTSAGAVSGPDATTLLAGLDAGSSRAIDYAALRVALAASQHG